MLDERGLIEDARSLGGDYFLLKIAAPRIAAAAKPGNFVMVRVSPSSDPLLRRPLGILESRLPYIWLYYKVLGHGTRMLSQLGPGDGLDILGPLGNVFPELPGKRVLLIAGGRGIVPCSTTPGSMASTSRCSCCTAAAPGPTWRCWNASRPCACKACSFSARTVRSGKRDSLAKAWNGSCARSASTPPCPAAPKPCWPGWPCCCGRADSKILPRWKRLDGLWLRRLPGLRGPHRVRRLSQGLRRGPRLSPRGDPMADLKVDLGSSPPEKPVVGGVGHLWLRGGVPAVP